MKTYLISILFLLLVFVGCKEDKDWSEPIDLDKNNLEDPIVNGLDTVINPDLTLILEL